MITFNWLGSNGRFGNQLFQYAAAKALSLHKKTDLVLPNLYLKSWQGQKCLLPYLSIPDKILQAPLVRNDYHKISNNFHRFYEEPDYMKFDSNFFSLHEHTDINGYFQSTLYFGDHAEEIKKCLLPREDELLSAWSYLDNLKENGKFEKIVSLHLRRGDNTDRSNPSNLLNNMYGEGEKLTTTSFYGRYLLEALDKFRNEKIIILVFSGGLRDTESNVADLEWCRKNIDHFKYPNHKIVYSNSGDTMADFCRIIGCDHNILSHVSSFGWWAAYLNPNKDKKVVAPYRYHPDRPDYTHREGFYPKEWLLV